MSIELHLEIAAEVNYIELQRRTEALLSEKFGISVRIQADNGDLTLGAGGTLGRVARWVIDEAISNVDEPSPAMIELCAIIMPEFSSNVRLGIAVEARNTDSWLLMIAATISAAELSNAKFIEDSANMFGFGTHVSTSQLLVELTRRVARR